MLLLFGILLPALAFAGVLVSQWFFLGYIVMYFVALWLNRDGHLE